MRIRTPSLGQTIECCERVPDRRIERAMRLISQQSDKLVIVEAQRNFRQCLRWKFSALHWRSRWYDLPCYA
jgi:hypothetical protein